MAENGDWRVIVAPGLRPRRLEFDLSETEARLGGHGPGVMRRTFTIFCLPLISSLALGCADPVEEQDSQGTDVADDDAALACIESFSVEQGYGFESDNEGLCPQPPGGGLECPPITPESVAEECDEDGHPCEPDAFMTREAASCIAEAEGLDEGLSEWRIELIYDYGNHAPIWLVSNTTLVDPADCREEGESMSIDAQTGELVEIVQWLTIC